LVNYAIRNIAGNQRLFACRVPLRNEWAGALFSAVMFGWAITFLIVALVAALFGFGGVATFAVDIARIIFFVAIGLFVISAVSGLIRGRRPRGP
jgi:uncharacterized membrane protein YtjA (UPF0391 family)